MRQTLTLDTEVYRDYFLASFLNIETGNVRHFEMFEGQEFDIETVKTIMHKYRIVTFNGSNFDIPLLAMVLEGDNCARIKRGCDAIINNNLRDWQFYRQFGVDRFENINHVDLIEVAPGKASLKMYGGRLHSHTLQDLPIEPSASISVSDRALLVKYCENDLKLTRDLYNTLLPQINLREQMSHQYALNLLSKSDAQIAEAVIGQEVSKALGEDLTRPIVETGTQFSYVPPDFIDMTTLVMSQILPIISEHKFTIPDSGKVMMPKALSDYKITIGNSIYRMGIGGLHSTESSVFHLADDDTLLIDRDVVSYYPMIILNTNLAPEHMGKAFSDVYGNIVDRRIKAKRDGDKVTSDALKITINGSFGKFGSKWSKLYSPDLLIQTTLTGQLCLLMLIEMLESESIPVVSANTDGIVIKCPKTKIEMMDLIVWEWEVKTDFETEATYYKAIYSRDVNNYIAVKTDGNIKLKGAYTPAGLSKNPANEVCTLAVLKYLIHGLPIAQTITDCTDMTKFVSVRQVKGGAVKNGEYLGRVVRWYYSIAADGAIHYKVNNYTVAKTTGAMPLMVLPDAIPFDIDYDWYINEANSLLKDLGVVND